MSESQHPVDHSVYYQKEAQHNFQMWVSRWMVFLD